MASTVAEPVIAIMKNKLPTVHSGCTARSTNRRVGENRHVIPVAEDGGAEADVDAVFFIEPRRGIVERGAEGRAHARTLERDGSLACG